MLLFLGIDVLIGAELEYLSNIIVSCWEVLWGILPSGASFSLQLLSDIGHHTGPVLLIGSLVPLPREWEIKMSSTLAQGF